MTLPKNMFLSAAVDVKVADFLSLPPKDGVKGAALTLGLNSDALMLNLNELPVAGLVVAGLSVVAGVAEIAGVVDELDEVDVVEVAVAVVVVVAVDLATSGLASLTSGKVFSLSNALPAFAASLALSAATSFFLPKISLTSSGTGVLSFFYMKSGEALLLLSVLWAKSDSRRNIKRMRI